MGIEGMLFGDVERVERDVLELEDDDVEGDSGGSSPFSRMIFSFSQEVSGIGGRALFDGETT